jgi:hypothetical protein
MQGKISGINGISPICNPFDFKKGKYWDLMIERIERLGIVS